MMFVWLTSSWNVPSRDPLADLEPQETTRTARGTSVDAFTVASLL
jgi:hypothetical protein